MEGSKKGKREIERARERTKDGIKGRKMCALGNYWETENDYVLKSSLAFEKKGGKKIWFS